MWQPKKITFTNLFAHKDSPYEFRAGQCVVIFGSNETDKGMENNGAGKTTLFEAICIALTGDSLRGIKKDAFINRDEDDCRIEFELTNAVLKSSMKIVRHFYRGGKTTKVELWEDGELNKQMTSTNEINKRIVELLGISREDLLNYYIISQDNSYVFFTASDVDKKDIMNRITSANMIKPVLAKIDAEVKQLQSEIDDKQREVSKIEGKIESIEEQRQECLLRSSNAEEIERLKNKVESLNEELQDAQVKVSDMSDELDKKTKEFEKLPPLPSSEELRTRIREIREEIDEKEAEKSENKTYLNSIQSVIDGAIECPNCSHVFSLDGEVDLTIDEAKEAKKVIEEEIENCDAYIKSKEKEAAKFNKELSEIRALESERNEQEGDLVRFKRKLKSAKEDVANIESSIERTLSKINRLNEETSNDSAIVELDKRREQCEADLANINKELSKIEKRFDLVKFWQFNMGKNGFMTYLANKSIKIIEGVTNSFLAKFGVDIRVEMTGFTVLKSGEVREKIDVFVQNDGLTSEPFMSKSGGERGRVALAGVLAIQHLINLSCDGRGLDLLLFDECFKGLDSRGQENIIKIFEGLGLTSMVITQNVSDEFNIENILMVQKVDGVSSYV